MRFLAAAIGSRREFFRATARYTLFGVTTTAAWLMARRAQLPGQKCINRGICAGCGQFIQCELPQALSAKHFKGKLS
jgi:hypothetical protein